MSDRWNAALEAAAKVCNQLREAAYKRYERGHGFEWRLVYYELGDAHLDILALREAAPGGREKAAAEEKQ